MSGSPVFSLNDRSLIGIISIHNQWMQAQLEAVSIYWLLENDFEFKKLIESLKSKNNEIYLYFNECLVKFFCSCRNDALFAALVERFVNDGIKPEATALAAKLLVSLEEQPIEFLGELRLCCEPIMKSNPTSISLIKQLLFLLLALYASNAAAHMHSGCVYDLAVRTRMAVEINLAAHYKILPELEEKTDENLDVKERIAGRYSIDATSLREVGWKPEAQAEEVTKIVHTALNKVHKKVYGAEPKQALDEFDCEDLNATILMRRKGEQPQLIRLEIGFSPELEKQHPLYNSIVCDQLSNTLKELPIVRFGVDSAPQEAQLRAQVNEFFRLIKQYSI